jgi:hypothetical protein
LQHVVHPAPLGAGQVLDQAPDAELAGGRRGPRLLVGEPVGGHPDEVSLLGKEGE